MISRTYRSPADLEAMVQLVASVRPPEAISDFPSILDLRELLSLPENQTAARMWVTNEGRLAGFALVDPANNLLFEIDPALATKEMEDELVAWGVSKASAQLFGIQQLPSLDTACRWDRIDRQDFLARHGFARVPGEAVKMERALAQPIPDPILPDGFSIRPIAGEQEVEAYVALQRAAFGTQNMTAGRRLAILGAQEYIPELDLVAVDAQGRLAGLCVCRISATENQHSRRVAGWIDLLATHPAHRRWGLGCALLLTGLRRLKDRGMEAAWLSTNGDNPAMIRTASQAGFAIVSAIYWYSKPLGTPAPLDRQAYQDGTK